jgi:dTDP-4-amino-4,6-dideoxygalactose transaminase
VQFNRILPTGTLLRHIEAAVQRVLRSGWYVLGPEVARFEEEFAAYHSVAHAVGVSSGTDAIELALRAAGVGPGDEVITVGLTAVATVTAIERAGARPVLVDICPDTYTMDPDAAAAAVGPRTRAIVPVHLYGHPADLTGLSALALRHGLLLLEDCAQAHGARWDGLPVGRFGRLGAFSFYPTKNLGALGDSGAVITDDRGLAERLRLLRNYGQRDRYEHLTFGVNSRLDEMQAAVLRAKLRFLDRHNLDRHALAMQYNANLRGVVTPTERPSARHAFHLYVIRHPMRDMLQAGLDRCGIDTLIHYPIPVHLQPAFAHVGPAPGGLPVTERVASEVLSLPMYPGMPARSRDRVIRAVQLASSDLGEEAAGD